MISSMGADLPVLPGAFGTYLRLNTKPMLPALGRQFDVTGGTEDLTAVTR